MDKNGPSPSYFLLQGLEPMTLAGALQKVTLSKFQLPSIHQSTRRFTSVRTVMRLKVDAAAATYRSKSGQRKKGLILLSHVPPWAIDFF